MLQATLQDSYGNTLELGWSWNPIDWAKDTYNWAADATTSAGRAIKSGAQSTWDTVKDGAQWVWDANCKVAGNPYMQAANMAAMAIPTGYTQVIGAAVIANQQACAMANQPDMPPPGEFPVGPPPAVPGAMPPPAAPGAPPPTITPQMADRLPRNIIFAADPDVGGYRVAQTLSGLYGASLGAAMEIGIIPTRPPHGQEVDLKTYSGETGVKTSASAWYKNPWVWGGVGAGVLLLGGGLMMMRRR